MPRLDVSGFDFSPALSPGEREALASFRLGPPPAPQPRSDVAGVGRYQSPAGAVRRCAARLASA